MKLSSDELKAWYRERTSRSGPPRDPCVSQDMLLRAATGTLNRRERERLADHLVTCSDCAEEYKLIQALRPWAQEAAAPFEDPAAEADSGRIFVAAPEWVRALWDHVASVPRWRAVSATVLIVVAAGLTLVYWRDAGPGRQPVQSERGDAAATRMRVEPRDNAVIPVAPTRLAWPAMPSAESYQVVLYDRDSTPIWESPFVTATAIDVPQTVRQRLLPGQPVYWRVIAQTGIERRQSEVFQFVIER